MLAKSKCPQTGALKQGTLPHIATKSRQPALARSCELGSEDTSAQACANELTTEGQWQARVASTQAGPERLCGLNFSAFPDSIPTESIREGTFKDSVLRNQASVTDSCCLKFVHPLTHASNTFSVARRSRRCVVKENQVIELRVRDCNWKR